MSLSIDLALDQLRDATEAERAALLEHQAKRAYRDSVIADLMSSGIRSGKICAITGLSRDRVNVIANRERKDLL